MKVNFGKIVPISTVDWHGRSTCMLFFNGCPFRCNYCQNHRLIDNVKWVDIENIENEITGLEMFISAVAFSGGEPTAQPEALIRLTKFIKSRGLLVGIQTNGYYSEILRELTRKKLVDKIFLDVKTSPLDKDKYMQITNSDHLAADRVVESLNIPLATIEARTTIFRSINDSLDIAKYLADNNYSGEYVIQQGHPWNAPNEKIRKENILNRNEMMYIAKNIITEIELKGIKIRTREKGEEVVI